MASEKVHHSVLSDAEILSAYRDFQARQKDRVSFVPLRNDPNHRGVMDANYVRPAPSDFPKMVYRKSASAPAGYATRVVESQEEQDALPKGWSTSAEEIHALLNSLIPAAAAGEAVGEEVEPAKQEAAAKPAKPAKKEKPAKKGK
jgi:hypothetical protein